MKKTLVGVNTLTSINPMAYNSHCQEWYRIGKDFPNEEIVQFLGYLPCPYSIKDIHDTTENEFLKKSYINQLNLNG